MLKSKFPVLRNKKIICFRWLLSFFFISSFISAVAQNESEKGLPFITNYTAKMYNGNPANWSIIQDNDGMMYFGQTNSQSNLLQYDGVKWQKIVSPPSSTILRCLTKDNDGIIYYGGVSDLGYLDKDSIGKTFQHSLLQFIPKDKRNFFDVWSLHVTEKGIYFQSRERLFRLTKSGKGKNSSWAEKSWDPSTHFMYSFFLDGVLYVHEQGVGLLKMVNDSLVLIPGSEFLGTDRMQVMLPYNSDATQKNISQKEYLASTFLHGMYIFDGTNFKPFVTEADSVFRKFMVYKGLNVNGNYAFSVLGYGLVIINAQGKLIQVISRNTAGLPSDIIYSMYIDSKDDVWLGLDNGISKININSPFTNLNLQSGITASPLSLARLPDGSLYVGTNNGLLRFNHAVSKFELVDNVPRNQIFDLLVDGNTLLITNDGLYVIKNGKTFLVESPVNNLKIAGLYISKKYPEVLYAGTTYGISVFVRNPAKPAGWEYLGDLPGLKEEARFFAEAEDGRLWACGLNGSPYRITITVAPNGKPDISKTHIENIGERLRSKILLGSIFPLNHKIYFTSDSATYTFNETKNHFEEATFDHLRNFSGKEDSTGKIWLATGINRDSAKFIIATPQGNGSYRLDSSALLPLLDQAPFNLYPDKNGIVWFITVDGLVRYDGKIKRNVDQSYKTLISDITSYKQQLNPGVTSESKPPEIKFNHNSLRFEYAASFYEQEDKIEYQTWLEGFEKTWSDWGKNTYKEYTNLSPGTYKFHVRAKNLYHKLSEEASYSFIILSPWYRTWWAYLLYALIFLFAGFLILKWRTAKLKEKHRELEKTVEERTSQLSQRVAELAVINSVQEALVSEMDMQGIYDVVGDRIRNVFDAQVVGIATFDHASQVEQFCYVIEKGERIYPDARPFDNLRKHLINTRQNVFITKKEEAFLWFKKEVVPGTKPMLSGIFMPLLVGEKVTGYISLQNVDREHAFSESDVKLLETLANSMSVALENARLFDETNRLLKETEQRTAELSVINSVQEGLAKELDMQGIYNLVGDRVQKLFNAQAVIIASFDLDNKMEHFNYLFEKGEMHKQESRPINKLRQLLIDKKHTIYIDTEKKASEEYGITAIGDTEMPKSLLFVPLLTGNIIKGYVSLQNIDTENAFSVSDIRLLETLSNSMSVALENARLFDETNRLLKETEQRTAELAVINSVQDGLAKELDMQGIYNLVGERVQKLFNAQVVLIATFDHENQLENFNYHFEKGEISHPAPRPFDKGRKYLIETGQNILINEDITKAAAEYGMRVVPGTEMPKSILFMPLKVGDKVTGYVSLQNIDIENAFSPSDVRLLSTLSNSMSVALENARLFDETSRLLKETEQRTAELSVINSVQEGLAKELDMQAIYDLVGQRISNVFQAQAMIIATLDPETKTEHFNYVIEKGERFYLKPRPYDKLREHLIATKEKILVNNNFEEAAARFGLNVLPGTQLPKSLLFVPLIISDKVKSYVSLQNVDIENAFSDADVRLLETLANSMSVALENARLFDETNRLLKETEQKTAELAVINSVQDGLVREMNIQSIYDLVGNRICELFDTQTVIIRTFNHTNGNEEWQFAIERGERLHSEPRPLIWANKQLILSKQSLLINENYAQFAAKHGGKGVSKGLPPKSAVFVPMIVGDVVRGSVSLQNVEKENAFSENDLRLLTTLTNSMSVALENARLFDETTHLLTDAKHRATELSTVNNISKALASQLNPDDLIKLVGDQMKDLFKANIVYLALLDKKTRIIKFVYQYGEVMPSRKIGDGLTSKILLTGEPLLINTDIVAKAEALGIQQMGLPAASYLGVPIPVGDEIIGVLSVQSTEQENRFNENDLRLLSTIASSVGVALKNAQLFEEVEQAKMEAELSSRTAEKANEAKSAFLSTVSHELRTPLTSVLGFAKIIKKRLEEKIFPALDKTDPKTEKTVDQISENLKVVISEGERLTHLINDVLDLAKIEAGKMEWNQENVSIPEVVERAVAATTSLFDQKDIKLIKHIDSDIPTIIGDTDKLIQVVINLFSNAVKFTNSGSVTCTLSHTNDEVIVSIADTGIGIAKEDFGAVFEQFKQVGGDTLTDKPKGTGLGLPICKEIIEHHGGRIWLESEVGKGSTFSFALPLIPAGPKNKDTPIHLNELMKQLKEQMVFSKLKIDGKNATILVVDDDDSIRSLLHQELSDAGYIIEEAKDGKMALESIRKNRPDLIILDVMMPEINGFDVAAILKNDPQTMDIPIIILSIVQDKARGFRIGVDRYLTKPIDTVKLFEEVGSLLEQGKSKKKVMVVDEDSSAVRSITEVLQAKGYIVVESDGKELVEKAISTQPDIIILNSVLSDKNEIVQSLRFEKGLENVLFLIYQ